MSVSMNTIREAEVSLDRDFRGKQRDLPSHRLQICRRIPFTIEEDETRSTDDYRDERISISFDVY